ncbi:hypothetical protein [Microlunatus spumicola]|uniref:hypothetical protein n=1 Tax=Microlunatus spumicola TaxID=81499 RepID=UPI00195B854E
MSQESVQIGGTEAPGWGPSAALMRRMLERFECLPEHVLQALQRAYAQTRGDGVNRLLMMPRDFAWTLFHDALKAHGLVAEFDAWWHSEMLPRGLGTWLRTGLPDALGAVMLNEFVDAGPFSRPDYDTLLAPWRAAVEGDDRSRVFLRLTPSWPHPGEELWQTVDAILLEPLAAA